MTDQSLAQCLRSAPRLREMGTVGWPMVNGDAWCGEFEWPLLKAYEERSPDDECCAECRFWWKNSPRKQDA